jgi:protein-disulfide isomerase
VSLLVPPLGPEDHRRGSLGAAVSLVEYGDYECQFCGRAQQVVAQVEQRLRGNLLYAFRHFPLSQVHPHAMPAAQAAEAAAAQGRFWDMHDTLYENQHTLEDEDLLEYAGELGLNVERFAQEVASGVHLPRVRRDVRSGIRSGVNGTPTFFVQGVRYDGGWDVDGLTRALESAMRSRDLRPLMP